jgi:hypothetical protein
MSIQAAGMPWFDEDDYASFRLILPERHWHDTFAYWQREAEKGLERFKAQGIIAVKAHVRSDLFAAWCRSTGNAINTQSLLAFANEVAARAYMDDQLH